MGDFARLLDTFVVTGDSTHTSFAGGKWKVPDGSRSIFVRRYWENVYLGGGIQHLNERVNGNPFRMYYDVDFKSEEQFDAVCAELGIADEAAFLDLLVSSITEHAYLIYHDDNDVLEDERLKELIVSKRIGQRGKYHVNLPGCIVDRSMAQYLATASSQCMLGKFNRRHDDARLGSIAGLVWKSVFDTGVYNSGLRLLGSRKTDAGDLGYVIMVGGAHEGNVPWLAVPSPAMLIQFERTMVLPDLTNAREKRLYLEVVEEGKSQGLGSGTYQDAQGLIRTGGITEPAEVATVIEYVNALRKEAAAQPLAPFRGYELVVSRVSRIVTSGGPKSNASLKGYFVTLADRRCPFKNDAHKRKTCYLYLSINKHGCALHCFDEACAQQSFPDKRVPAKGVALSALLGIAPDKRSRSRLELDAVQSREGRERSIRSLGGDPNIVFGRHVPRLSLGLVAENIEDDEEDELSDAEERAEWQRRRVIRQQEAAAAAAATDSQREASPELDNHNADDDDIPDIVAPVLGAKMIQRAAQVPIVTTRADGDMQRYFVKDLLLVCNFRNDAMLYQCAVGAMAGNHWDVANLAFHIFSRIYRVNKADRPIWYSFTRHRWTTRVQTFQIFMSECMVELLLFWRKIMIATNEMDPDDKLSTDRFEGLISKIKTQTFKDLVSKGCAQKFALQFPNFGETLDVAKHRLGFQNGVFDFEEGRFRHGVPEDNLTLVCAVNYQPIDEVDPFGEVRDEIKAFIASIFTNVETCEWFWEIMSKLVHGRMTEEILVVTGSGSNGKSKLVSLIQAAFGDYAVDLPVSFITSKRAGSGAASPEFMRTKGRRFAVSLEPEDGSKLNLGLIKGIVGGDVFSGRDLYESQSEFTPQFHLWLLCNNLPAIDATDEGAWRRIVIVELQTRFVDHPDPENSLERAIDPLLEKKITGWSQVFMLMLVERFLNTGNQRLEKCQEVLDATAEIRFEFNHLGTFVSNLEKDTTTSVAKMKFSDIDAAYRNHCISHDIKAIRGYLLKRALRDKFGPPFTLQDKSLSYKLRWRNGSPFATTAGQAGNNGGGPTQGTQGGQRNAASYFTPAAPRNGGGMANQL